MTTQAEKLHLSRVAALGCLPCKNMGHEGSEAMCHHIRSGQGLSQRASHWETIPLCHFHHQGPDGIHTIGTRRWEATHGTERKLLAQVRRELGIETEGEEE